MRSQSRLGRSVLGAAVVAALGFGVNAATATSAAAAAPMGCPGYTATAQICTDCCRNNYGGVGFWDPGSKYCNCAL